MVGMFSSSETEQNARAPDSRMPLSIVMMGDEGCPYGDTQDIEREVRLERRTQEAQRLKLVNSVGQA